MRPCLLKRLLGSITLTMVLGTGTAHALPEVSFFNGALAPHLEAPAPAQVNEEEALTRYISQTFGRSRELALRIVRTVNAEAVRVGIPPLLALAVIEKESKFRPEATNAGAQGLMQVVARYHRDKLANEPQGLFHPETNIKVGISVLTEYVLNSGGDLKKALVKYSGGSSAYSSQVQAIEGRLKSVASRPLSGMTSLSMPQLLSAGLGLPALCPTTPLELAALGPNRSEVTASGARRLLFEQSESGLPF